MNMQHIFNFYFFFVVISQNQPSQITKLSAELKIMCCLLINKIRFRHVYHSVTIPARCHIAVCFRLVLDWLHYGFTG